MWEQIRANRRKSSLLVVAVAAVLFAVGYFGAEAAAPGAGLVGLGIAFIIWITLALISYFGGDNIFLTLAGARKIEKKDLPVLYNVVEEMTIASGLAKVPAVYIVDDRAPNAFATGRDLDHAAVAVTTGLLQVCNRDELQGVVAHEMGHIKNRDTLLMLMAGVMVGTIVLLSDVGLRWMWISGGRTRRSRSSKGGGQAQAIILVIALLLMILGPLVAQFIYFAISRRREYLADASAALFTRYPEGLASALEKLSASPAKLSRATRATSPMYIINPLKRSGQRAADLTSTHPPISERVRILRSMAGVSLGDYDKAYRGARGGAAAGVLPAGELRTGQELKRRSPQASQNQKERAQSINNFFWMLQSYLFLTCACGTVLKIPPKFRGTRVKCPHCGRAHGKEEFSSKAPAETCTSGQARDDVSARDRGPD